MEVEGINRFVDKWVVEGDGDFEVIQCPSCKTPVAVAHKSAKSCRLYLYSLGYRVQRYALDSARVDEVIVVAGDEVAANTDGDLAGCSIKFNSFLADSIRLDYFNPIVQMQFHKLYLTTTAQEGKTLQLFIGRGKKDIQTSILDISNVVLDRLAGKPICPRCGGAK